MRERRRGRPKCPRRVEMEPQVTYYKPRGVPLADLEVTEISVEGLEAMRLVDLLGLEQEAAASRMGISRRAFWDELNGARAKLASALSRGTAIAIKGGDYVVPGRVFICSSCDHEWEQPFGTGRPRECPECGGSQVGMKRPMIAGSGQRTEGRRGRGQGAGNPGPGTGKRRARRVNDETVKDG